MQDRALSIMDEAHAGTAAGVPHSKKWADDVVEREVGEGGGQPYATCACMHACFIHGMCGPCDTPEASPHIHSRSW